MSMLLGIVGTLALLVWSMSLGGAVDAFVSIPSLALVVGGTACLVFARHGWDVFLFHLQSVGTMVRGLEHSKANLTPTLVECAALVKKEGTLVLEGQLQNVTDPYLRYGMQSIIDGCDESRLVIVLQQQVDAYERRFNSAVSAWRSWAEISPAMGLIGTLVGLVEMLRGMKNPDQIGPSMALALIATFYGVFFANVVAGPIAAKLQQHFEQQLRYFESAAAGLQMLLRGASPRVIEESLNSTDPWESVSKTSAPTDEQ